MIFICILYLGGGGGQEKFYAETLHTEAQPFPLLSIPNFWQKE